MKTKQDSILILDFGSQYTQLIARRIREQHVYSEIKPCQFSLEKIREMAPSGIILSGGPSSVYTPDAPTIDPKVLELGIPVLAICYGMQLITHLLGGKVTRSDKAEYGRAGFKPISSCPLFSNLPSDIQVWMSHGDAVASVPAEFIEAGTSDNTPHAAIYHPGKKIYGLQFHPEVTHSDFGKNMIENFLFSICGCQKSWSMSSFIDKTVEDIRAKVGNEKVICALSGGVDSTVVAVLIHKAIGSNLICVFVDNGLLRKGEREKVENLIRSQFNMNLVVVDAEEEFLKELDGVIDPEIKRKKIGHTFIDIFDAHAKEIGGIKFLAQGTLYPDVIESVSAKGGPSATIKSHHNVGGLPEKMNMSLVEPLRELFKDEVRQVGRLLGISEEIISRQPFPGPGLAVRILGEITRERCDILREADAVVVEEIKKAGLYQKIWQSFAILLPLKTVGVMGDDRTYENVVAIRAVDSFDGMTADWVRLPYDLLAKISNRIINEVDGVNRVVYDISSKPPATIEWE